MKKLFTIIFWAIAFVSVNADEPVQQHGATYSCPTLSCAFVSNGQHTGNMFDISALKEITVTAFSAEPSSTTSIEIYFKVGSYVGYETDSSAWTLAGSASNVLSAFPGITFLPITLNITIPAGLTYGWYITSTNNNVFHYNTVGTQAGSIFSSDSNLVFKEGISLSYPFGTPVQNQIFDGAIHYCEGSLSTNILENNFTAATVFPNPVTGKAKVSFDYSSMHSEVTLEVFSLLGEKINLPQSVQRDGIVIDTQSLSRGIYCFLVLDEKKILIDTGKFFVL